MDDPSFLWKDTKEKYLQYNLTIWQAYNQLSFHADQDYELTFEYSTTFGEETYSSELKPTSQKEIATYSYGMCSLTTFSDIVKPNIQWKMNVKFKRTLDTKGFKIFVSSPDILHGLFIDEWPYDKLILDGFETSFDVGKYAFMNLLASEVQYLTASSSYNDPDECIQDFMNSTQCSFKCFPIVFNYLGFPPCTTKAEVGCMFSYLYGERKMQLYDCMKPKKSDIYRFSEKTYNEPQPQNDSMQVKFVFQSNIKTYYEQVYVVSFTSFIGNVGGSLGLFFGFSFFAVFFDCIDKIFRRFQLS